MICYLLICVLQYSRAHDELATLWSTLADGLQDEAKEFRFFAFCRLDEIGLSTLEA
jgi:hypothetical protein